MKRPLLLLAAGLCLHAQPVRYVISAQLDDAAGMLRGEERVCIRNSDSVGLGSVWFHLYPNAFRSRATSFAREMEACGRYDFSLARESERGWISIDSLESDDRVVLFTQTETELGLFLCPPLGPGESLGLRIEFTLKLPAPFSSLGRKGRSFFLAHWYPAVAARTDDWRLDGYHLYGRSPSAFADYDVTITLASDLAVAASAALPDSGWTRCPPVLRPGRRDSLKTVRLTGKNVTDFALVLSPDLIASEDEVAGTLIRVLARYPVKFGWLDARATVADIVRCYSAWFGPCPWPTLTVVQADQVASTDASYPGLVVMAQRWIPGTRVFEQALARQIALQWFGAALGIDELRAPWLAQGPAAYAEVRYLEEKHGPTNLLSDPTLSWLFQGVGAEYFHAVSYYTAAANRVLCPDPLSCRDQLGYSAENQSKPGLLLLETERELGRPGFDSLMQEYLRQATGRHADVATFARYFPEVAARMNPADSFALAKWGRLGSDGVELKPLIARPKTDKYQLFFGPYIWADNYHGLQLSAWAQGRQFYDAGPFKGRHQWTASEVYSTKIGDWHSSVSYQTPLYFLNDRLRLYTALDYSQVDAGAKLYFTQELGPAFRQPKTTIDFGYRILDLYNLRFRDRRAWDSARTADYRLRLTHTYETRLFLGGAQVHLRRGLVALGSNYNYLRLGLEQTHTWRGLRPFHLGLRLFLGQVWGEVPAQDQFYLSGGLTSNSSEPVSWGYEGWTSGQEHWHYDGDANCRGYAGEYRHGRAAYGLNTELTLPKWRIPLVTIHPFFDLGNVASSLRQPDFLRPRLDAGIRLKLGPLYADFPFWRYQLGTERHEFAFRWLLGLKLGGVLSGL